MEKEEKNNSEQEFKGKNLEDVILQAEHALKLHRSEFSYEIIAEKTKLFGMKSKEIVISAFPKKGPEDDPVAQFLDDIFSLFPLDIKYQIKRKNDVVQLIFEGADKHLLLRKDGALLMAFQHILNKISTQKVQADCDFYRKRKEKQIREYAQHMGNHVNETGREEILDMMNPYERRIVHIAINQISGITTESIGEGFLKRIRISTLKDQVT